MHEPSIWIWTVTLLIALVVALWNSELRELRDEWKYGEKRNAIVIWFLILVLPPLYLFLAGLDYWLKKPKPGQSSSP
jgi:hypothetical protein